MGEFGKDRQPGDELENQLKLQKSEEEFRTEQAEKVAEFLRRIHAYDYVKSLTEEKEDRPDFKEFEDFLVRLNGIAREIPIAQRKTDGENVYLKGWMGNASVPKQEDKKGLLKYAYESAKDVEKEDVKYMLPAVVNAVHMFADGNGRTSRILHQLLESHASEKEFLDEVKKALQSDGRYETLDINPAKAGAWRIVAKNHGWEFSEDGYPSKILGCMVTFDRRALRKIEIPEEAKGFFALVDSGDTLYPITALHLVFGGKIEQFLTDEKKVIDRIDPVKIVETLSHENWKRLMDNFYSLKKEEVEALVNIFKTPEKYKREIGGKEITFRDNFIEMIDNPSTIK